MTGTYRVRFLSKSGKERVGLSFTGNVSDKIGEWTTNVVDYANWLKLDLTDCKLDYFRQS